MTVFYCYIYFTIILHYNFPVSPIPENAHIKQQATSAALSYRLVSWLGFNGTFSTIHRKIIDKIRLYVYCNYCRKVCHRITLNDLCRGICTRYSVVYDGRILRQNSDFTIAQNQTTRVANDMPLPIRQLITLISYATTLKARPTLSG